MIVVPTLQAVIAAGISFVAYEMEYWQEQLLYAMHPTTIDTIRRHAQMTGGVIFLAYGIDQHFQVSTRLLDMGADAAEHGARLTGNFASAFGVQEYEGDRKLYYLIILLGFAADPSLQTSTPIRCTRHSTRM